jgi:hypothetical protein
MGENKSVLARSMCGPVRAAGAKKYAWLLLAALLLLGRAVLGTAAADETISLF